MNTFKHGGGLGDMILGLPTIIALGGGEYLLRDDQIAKLGRLFEVQPYMTVRRITDIEWKNIEVTHNLDLFRGTISAESIAEMHLGAFNVKFDLSQPWLFNIPENKIAKIVINDTGMQRFPGRTIDWNLLKGYEKDCIFIGYKDSDYGAFIKNRKLNIEHYSTADLFEVAKVIAGCNLFIGNQSSAYTIAEGLKKTLAIDLYEGKPQYPFGKNGYTGISTSLLEEYIR